MSSFLKVITTSSLLGMFISSVSFASPGFGGGRMRGQGMGMGMENQVGTCVAKMNLSKEQSDKVAILYKEFDPKHDGIVTEMRNLHRQLRDLYLAKAGSDKTNPIVEKITTLRTEQQKLRTDMHAKMQGILTSEQLAVCPNMGFRNESGGGMWYRGW